MRGWCRARLLLAVGAAVAGGACARQGAPPGGPEDQRPPVVVSTTPAAFDRVDDPAQPIVFRFDERISERPSGVTLDEAVTISPRTGDVRVSHGRRDLTVRVDGGLRPGIVYRVTLQAVVSDMFGNRLVDPFELVFSTGGEPAPTTVAGEVWDRITGRGVAEASVQAVGPDGLVHVTGADRDGIYAFRYLPAGELDVVAFEDRNRDGAPDSTEVQGRARIGVAVGDTLFRDIAVLPPDTTPANVMDAEVVDSVTVAVRFDDPLDPDQAVDDLVVDLSREDGAAPAVVQRFQEAAYAAFVEVVTDSLARLDSIDAEAAAEAAAEAVALEPDSLSGVEPDPPADSVAISPEPDPEPVLPMRRPPPALTPGSGPAPGPVEGTDRVLPGRRVVLLLDAPLELDAVYTVRIDGARNIHGLPDGGGDAEVLWEVVPDTVGVDPLGIDTLALPDTGAVARPDTAAVSAPLGAGIRRSTAPTVPSDPRRSSGTLRGARPGTLRR